MDIFFAIIFLVIGFVLLIKGADFFVDGSSNIAKLFKVPSIIIGLTVVALGTSLPEAAVSISSSIAGQNALAVSNVVGSNFINTLVVLGASAVIMPVAVQKSTVKKEIPFSLLCTVVLLGALVLGMDRTDGADGTASQAVFNIGRIGGAVLLLIFAFYMFWQISSALKAHKRGELEEDEGDGKAFPLWKSLIFIVGGVAAIVIGGDLVVDCATLIAEKLGMSQTLVGLTVVALGTSLPELVTSMVAAKKGESDLAVGNVIGSNIMNIVFVLAFSALISPITVDILAVIDTIAVIGVTCLVWVFSATGLKISRIQGGMMIATYAAYLFYVIMR